MANLEHLFSVGQKVKCKLDGAFHRFQTIVGLKRDGTSRTFIRNTISWMGNNMTKRNYNVILKYKDYTIISYEKKYMGTEYVIARNFNAEEFSWDSARDNYAYSLESALATLLSRLGSDYVKSQRQLEIERNTGITFDRAKLETILL